MSNCTSEQHPKSCLRKPILVEVFPISSSAASSRSFSATSRSPISAYMWVCETQEIIRATHYQASTTLHFPLLSKLFWKLSYLLLSVLLLWLFHSTLCSPSPLSAAREAALKTALLMLPPVMSNLASFSKSISSASGTSSGMINWKKY